MKTGSNSNTLHSTLKVLILFLNLKLRLQNAQTQKCLRINPLPRLLQTAVLQPNLFIDSVNLV